MTALLKTTTNHPSSIPWIVALTKTKRARVGRKATKKSPPPIFRTHQRLLLRKARKNQKVWPIKALKKTLTSKQILQLDCRSPPIPPPSQQPPVTRIHPLILIVKPIKGLTVRRTMIPRAQKAMPLITAMAILPVQPVPSTKILRMGQLMKEMGIRRNLDQQARIPPMRIQTNQQRWICLVPMRMRFNFLICLEGSSSVSSYLRPMCDGFKLLPLMSEMKESSSLCLMELERRKVLSKTF
mmetsp:Transcript_14780/g.32131  ORF Transcript_14780/g.32131 Transcript_14780/m.32131 type:complete len:240 (+) Transcript_14780:437-1156(+)